jgi:hypothetical protein
VTENGQTSIRFTFLYLHSRERLAKRLTQEQQRAVYKFMQLYYLDGTGNRKAWPREVRAVYNAYQRNERLKIHLPRVFVSCFGMPNNYCRYVLFPFFLGGGRVLCGSPPPLPTAKKRGGWRGSKNAIFG